MSMMRASLQSVMMAFSIMSCAHATKKAPGDNPAAVPIHYGPGDCVSIWKSPEGHCVMQTQCKAQDISHYVFSMLCIDQGGLATRNVFGEGSFAAEETFDTLIVCNRCAPDAPTGYAPDAQQSGDAAQAAQQTAAQQPAAQPVTNTAEIIPPAGTITIMGQATKADVVEMKHDMATQAQLHAVQQEVDELKADMQSMNKAINQLGLKVFSAQLPAQVAPAHASATSSVMVARTKKGGRTLNVHKRIRGSQGRMVQTVPQRLRKKRVAAPHLDDDGDIADPDEEDDAAIADGVADTSNSDDNGDEVDQDDSDSGVVAFQDKPSNDEEEDVRMTQDSDDDLDDR